MRATKGVGDDAKTECTIFSVGAPKGVGGDALRLNILALVWSP